MMRRMQEDLDRMFGELFGGEAGTGAAAAAGETGLRWAPQMDVSESDREWCVEAELPGVDRNDIHVQLENHHLVLRAETRQETGSPSNGEAERQYHHRERRYGYFQRVIPLPENVNEEQVSCEFRDGVLTVHLPKTQQGRTAARRVPIQEVENLPSETAGGRMRSEAELEMTEDEEGTPAGGRPLAGAKGGATGSTATTGTSSSGGRTSARSAGSTSRSSGMKTEGGATGESGKRRASRSKNAEGQ